MILDSIKIDGQEYKSLVIDKEIILNLAVEDELNNPKSSYFECEFLNTDNLQNLFLNTDPYGLSYPGHVTANLLTDDPDTPFGTSTQVFEGYLDRENIEVYPHDNIIRMRFVGIEQNYSKEMDKYDISQAYYELNPDDDIGQRGNRVADERIDPDDYNLIATMVENILDDLGFDSDHRVVEVPNSSYFKYKYNAETYGDLANETTIVTRGYNTLGQRLPNTESVTIHNFVEINTLNESYSNLIRQFAVLTGCVWFFNHKDQKFYFVPRNYSFNADYDLDNYVIQGKVNQVYRTPYNGVVVNFKDITISAKRTISYPSFSETIKYGFESKTARDTATQVLTNSTYYVKDGESFLYKLGSTQAESNLYISMPIEIDLEDNLSDYIEPGVNGDSIETFLTKILDNYDYTMGQYRITDMELSYLAIAPLNITYGGDSVTVFDSTVDLQNSTTKLTFGH